MILTAVIKQNHFFAFMIEIKASKYNILGGLVAYLQRQHSNSANPLDNSKIRISFLSCSSGKLSTLTPQSFCQILQSGHQQ
jgi:hypothetical protein